MNSRREGKIVKSIHSVECRLRPKKGKNLIHFSIIYAMPFFSIQFTCIQILNRLGNSHSRTRVSCPCKAFQKSRRYEIKSMNNWWQMATQHSSTKFETFLPSYFISIKLSAWPPSRRSTGKLMRRVLRATDRWGRHHIRVPLRVVQCRQTVAPKLTEYKVCRNFLDVWSINFI